MDAPGHASAGLGNKGAQGGQHGPPAVDELILAEAAQPKDLVIGRQSIVADGAGLHGGRKVADNIPGQIDSLVLVLLVLADL